MLNILKNEIKVELENYYKSQNVDVTIVVEQPKNLELGDICVPVFGIVKLLKKPLPEVVKEVEQFIAQKFSIVNEVNAVGGFLNIKINKDELSVTLLKQFYNESNPGFNNLGMGKKVVMDYSHPNIAKSFSIGHLRSTMIGNALRNIYRKCNFEAFALNYLGDWGTQFGKMIVAYKLWGDKKKIEANPIHELSILYVKFHQEAKEDEKLEDMAREAFKKLENNDEEYLKLWEWIKDESLKESQAIYELLEVDFDSFRGEAYYNDKMDPIVKELEDKNLLVEDQGAMIVNVGDDLPPALIKKKDGASLYLTRDLAAIYDRYNTYDFVKAIYVVGNEQKLHFVQLQRVLQKLDKPFKNDTHHINFGLVLKNGKKMSTRDGGVVKLQDVLDLAIKQALMQITEKNPTLEDKETIARHVGVGAVVFNDLKNHRTLNYEFDLEKMLKFEGQTGPYLQYTVVRINSILKNSTLDINNINSEVYAKAHYFELVRSIGEYSTVLQKACLEDAPSIVAKYLLNVAQQFNKFYSLEKVIVDNDSIRNSNLLLSYNVAKVISDGLNILGIKTVSKM